MSNALAEAFAFQACACTALGAGFSAAILACAGEDIAAGGPVAALLAAWADQPVEQLTRDAVALRLLASLHHLVLTGAAPDLATFYPPRADDPTRAWTAARQALVAHAGPAAAFLAHEPQTNEVRRSACLLGGFLTIAQATGLPLRCFELGASAGLNSLWDRYRYDIGGHGWGRPDSRVSLPCHWEGPAPHLGTDVTVVERQACDRRPVDLHQADEVTRLLAYCWAEQGERMARLRAAVAQAQAESFRVDASPASAWIGRAGPQRGTATVVFHSIVWQYMPRAEQDAVWQALQGHMAGASNDAPFFWLRMEPDAANRQFELRLWAAPRAEDRLLAIVHPHGEYVRWL